MHNEAAKLTRKLKFVSTVHKNARMHLYSGCGDSNRLIRVNFKCKALEQNQ